MPTDRNGSADNASPSGWGALAVRLYRRASVLEIKDAGSNYHFVLAMSVFGALNVPISAFGNPELEACRLTGLIALRERDPSIKDVTLDFDGMNLLLIDGHL